MKIITTLCVAIYVLTGCTTLQPVPSVPNDLSGHFNDGGVLKPGDHIIITTVTGATHALRVTSVHDGVIVGDHESIPFSEVASIVRKDPSPTKTTILVTSIAAVVAFLAIAAHAAAHPNAGI
jgi:hypothetical protein